VSHGSKHRDRMEIIKQILELANGNDTKKIKIQYKANLSYYQLKEYLPFLMGSDFLSYHLDTRTFKTTEKGLRFLDTYNQFDHFKT
jgi:predicted transcriptional regulator